MARRWRALVVAASVCCGLLLFSGAVPTAHADTNDFTIRDFSADQTLDNADRQGKLRIVERIQVHFTDHNHGLLRAIPTRYKSHSLQVDVQSVTSPSGAPASYSTYKENGNLVLKIGSPVQTITGDQEYTIEYTVRNVISFYPNHDELYWDVNGNGWLQKFDKVEVTLRLAHGLALNENQPVCYSGNLGSAGSFCTVAYNSQNSTVKAATTQPLWPRETLTTTVGFKKGYFAPSTALETVGEYKNDIIAGLAFLGLFALPPAIYWYRRGRDPYAPATIVPEYGPPTDIRPLEAGAIMDFKTDNRDITATLIDLAIRGYIKIIEEKKKKLLLGTSLTYTLELRNTDTASLAAYESRLLRALFAGYQVGKQTKIVQSTAVAVAAQAIRRDASKDLAARGYFSNNPYLILTYAVIIYGFIAAACLLALGGLKAGPGAFIGAIAGIIIGSPFLFALPHRTVKGVEAKRQLEGLKMFLDVTQADRLKKMQAPNAPYASNAHEPVKTVALFEKLLPYAMVLGVEKEWAKQFDSLYKTPPDWYSGNWTAFNATYLAVSISDSMASSVNNAFSMASNSSSSGFSGGFSGGGGGGGGGGGW